MFFHVQIPISSIKSERKNLFPMLWPAFINRIFKYRWNSCNIPCCFIEAREINVTQANRYKKKKKKKEKNIYTVPSLWCGNKIPLRHVVWFIRIRCTTIKRKKGTRRKEAEEINRIKVNESRYFIFARLVFDAWFTVWYCNSPCWVLNIVTW